MMMIMMMMMTMMMMWMCFSIFLMTIAMSNYQYNWIARG